MILYISDLASIITGSWLSNLDSWACGLQSSTELMKEIATLEVQILQLERYLLSLYRTAFLQHLPSSLGSPVRHLKGKVESHLHRLDTQPSCKMDLHISQFDVRRCDPVFHSSAVASSDYLIQAAAKSSSRRVGKSHPLKLSLYV